MKVLGMHWDSEADTLSVKPVKMLERSFVTMRTVLKQVAKLFDPLGMFAPVTLKGKLFSQKLWIKQLEWDEKLSKEDKEMWFDIKDDISKIANHKMNRCVTVGDKSSVTNTLVCFCDASAFAYATCVYLVQSSESQCNSELIFAKTRLAPTTQTAIPRLDHHVGVWYKSSC